MDAETERQAFERWYRKYRKFDTNPSRIESDPFVELLTRNGNDYKYGHPNSCWQAWKARALWSTE